LKSSSGKAIFTELVKGADVVVESFAPGVIAALGFSYDALRAINPGIILTSISNFGQTGPYRDLPASEIVLYGMGHAMFGTGQPDAEPMSMAPRVNLHLAGQTAAVAVLGAVLGKVNHGGGDWIDVSIMETLSSSIDRRAISLTAYDYTHEKMVRLASVQGISVPPTYNPCADGYFHMTVGQPWWNTFVEAVNEDFLRDGRFAPPLTDPLLREEFDAFWIPWCMQRTKRDIVRIFQERGMPVAPVNSVADLVDDPGLEVRGFFHQIFHPTVGPAAYPGLPFVLHGTPGALRTPAPRLGEHNAQVYGELGITAEDLDVYIGAGVV
jgi:crotonobetainyl-CoA:carnitine CoA-transferase CaiB-like acyl-CoA transferase